MTFFFILIFIIILFISIFLSNPKKKKVQYALVVTAIYSTSVIIYLFVGSIDSFFFEKKIEKEIESLIENPERLIKTDPKKLIFYLESKLKKNPNDLEGWKLLARTCLITGHNQKASLYYSQALKLFPKNEDILYEYAILKKNTNKVNGAFKLLDKIDLSQTNNPNIVSFFFELLKETRNFNILKEKIINFNENKNIDKKTKEKLIGIFELN